MEIEKFDPAADAESTLACYQIRVAAKNAEDPTGPQMSARSFGAVLAAGWIGNPRETWLARGDDGAPAGWYQVELPDRDNRQLAELELIVHPARRRDGLGGQLLRHAAGRAAAGGRRLISSSAWLGSAGESFAVAMGAAPGHRFVRRALDVTAPAQLAISTDAPGYSRLSWTGSTPAEYAADVAMLLAALADAPRDQYIEPEHWDIERVRVIDQRIAMQGRRYYSVAYRHDASGQLAGLTQLGVDPATPHWAFQEVTAVIRAHRGHRLGLRLKLAMTELLRSAEPRLEHIITWNAEKNDHMVAINELLGYVPLGRPMRSWELPVRST